MPIVLSENFRAVLCAILSALSRRRIPPSGVEVVLRPSPSPQAQPGPAPGRGRRDVGWTVARDDRARQRAGWPIVASCRHRRRDPFFIVGAKPRPEFGWPTSPDELSPGLEVPTPWICLAHDIRLAASIPDRWSGFGALDGRERCGNPRRYLDAAQLSALRRGAGRLGRRPHLVCRGDTRLTAYTTLVTRRGTLRAASRTSSP